MLLGAAAAIADGCRDPAVDSNASRICEESDSPASFVSAATPGNVTAPGDVEKVAPDFVTRLWLGDNVTTGHTFKGRTTETLQTTIPMKTSRN